ncbi:hypothetical protein BD410DRAFT_839358 [Rickenella mellea]|uniref:Uncharacterized protein n=1 Tax=Rickenella mellea TaxID=50990 RepID=A0A4Y7Q6K4_9AGAM|nr:hypothetical protein BD410DRAFT_839358 [Rickenella mellea]
MSPNSQPLDVVTGMEKEAKEISAFQPEGSIVASSRPSDFTITNQSTFPLNLSLLAFRLIPLTYVNTLPHGETWMSSDTTWPLPSKLISKLGVISLVVFRDRQHNRFFRSDERTQTSWLLLVVALVLSGCGLIITISLKIGEINHTKWTCKAASELFFMLSICFIQIQQALICTQIFLQSFTDWEID